jgi:dTDP-4-amino-4,6-dideoxygalactose transaminase
MVNNTDGNTVKAITDLAIFSGQPGFSDPLHVGRPNIGDRQKLMERINKILDRRWLTNDGPLCKELEFQLAKFLNVRHCIAICNGTVALEITIRALELYGEVIVPSFTFISTAHALQWQEITPVFCDIDPHTHNIDPDRIEQMITPRTTGIIGVHLWGRACNVEALADLAQKRNLKLMFDAAHAFGCSYKGQMIGNFGNAEVFSFHATKFFNTFEGGAIATNDDKLAEKIRLMKNFGFVDYDQVTNIGTNGKMSEISAAMGLTGLESIDAFIDANKRNYHQYRQELSGIPGINVISHDSTEKLNYQYMIIEVDSQTSGLTRDQIMKVLHAENVLVRRYFYPGCHRMEPYRSYFPNTGLLLPETEILTERVLVLPTGMAMCEANISTVCQIIRLAMAESATIAKRLQS